MYYSVIEKDNNNFTLVLSKDSNEFFRIEKYKDEQRIYYYFPVQGEKVYNFIIEYLAKILNVQFYSSIYDENSPMEDEYYCKLTKNLLVRYDAATGLVSVYVRDDNVNENKYDQIVAQTANEFYTVNKDLCR